MNKILFKGQHGFRSGHSCETALHELITDLNCNRNKKLTSLLLFIDFRKAFDLVDTRLLMRKLMAYGFDNTALKLIGDYFKDRFVSVKFDKKISDLMSINLGVPQGSVLGPLFFLIFINDLAFLLEDIMCKMFADDTTLYDAHEDLDKLISKFKKSLEKLIDWCKFNRLDLNWSKTFFMFVTNKRVQLPNEIVVDGNVVKVIKSFKLLGVTLDNKLNFAEHCSNVKKLINRKIYSIKRLFYLATTVKIQFFKTFILPYFDYCSTLLIYFPKSSIQSLNSCFNICLFKLFKFTPEKIDFEDILSTENGEGAVMHRFEETLQRYGLQTFQRRLLERFLLFTQTIINSEKSPPLLKEKIQLPDNSADDLDRDHYSLRGGAKVKNTIPVTKFDQLTFSYFFPRFISKTRDTIDFKLKRVTFLTQVNNLAKILESIFLSSFQHFNTTCFTYFKK